MEGGVDRQRQRTALQPSNPALGLRSELFPRRVCGYIIYLQGIINDKLVASGAKQSLSKGGTGEQTNTNLWHIRFWAPPNICPLPSSFLHQWF